MVGLLSYWGARLVCSYMTKSKLQTQLKLKKANRHNSCRISQNQLSSNRQEKVNQVSRVNKEILFKTDNSGIWTFLSPTWNELTGFTVAESIGNSFLDYIDCSDYQRNLELFQNLKSQHIEESVYKTRYKTSKGDVCLVKISIRSLLDRQAEMIGTVGTLELIDFENQYECDENEEELEDNECDADVMNANYQVYLEALIDIETALQHFDGSDDSYIEVLSIVGLTNNLFKIVFQ